MKATTRPGTPLSESTAAPHASATESAPRALALQAERDEVGAIGIGIGSCIGKYAGRLSPRGGSTALSRRAASGNRRSCAIIQPVVVKEESAVDLLGRVPLFAELERDDLERVSRVAVPRSFPTGTRVFHEGDHSDACYIVRGGSFRVTREHPDGRAITLANLGPGDIFGELAMFDGEVRSASVEALEDGELLALPGGDVRSLLARHPEITVKLVAALVRRLRQANERIARQSFQTVPSRVAGVLLQLVAEEAPHEGEGDHDPHEPDRPRPARRDLA